MGLGVGVDGVSPLGLTPLVLGLPSEPLGEVAAPLYWPLDSVLGLLGYSLLLYALAGFVPVLGTVLPLGLSPLGLEEALLEGCPFLWACLGPLPARALLWLCPSWKLLSLPPVVLAPAVGSALSCLLVLAVSGGPGCDLLSQK